MAVPYQSLLLMCHYCMIVDTAVDNIVLFIGQESLERIANLEDYRSE